MTRAHPLELPSGRILVPLYSDGYSFSLIAISDDGGATWSSSEPLVGAGAVQPTLVRRRDGAIVAYMRKLGTDIPVKKAAAAAQDPAALKNPYTELKSIKADAKSIYAKDCASCHGDEGKGGLGPALKGSTKSDAELYAIIANGIEANGMPGFSGSLDGQKIWKLVTLIKLGKSDD